MHGCKEAPLTEYEKERAQNMIRNNQVMRSLGVCALTSLLGGSSAQIKSKDSVPEHSGSLYEPNDNDDIEEGVVDKVYPVLECNYYSCYSIFMYYPFVLSFDVTSTYIMHIWLCRFLRMNLLGARQ